ncbi:hypothetical protein BH10BAC4_BH10BAC4_16120 [soil metagenome]
MKFRFLIGLILLTVSCVESVAQIRLEVIHHAKLSLSDSSIFLAGTINGWSPGDEHFKLTRRPDGVYYIDLPDTLTYFEYKFTQGGWALVEGSRDGKARPNRVYNRSQEIDPKHVQVEIEVWENQPAYVIVTKKIPRNTPHDAALYIMGDFNNWNPADKTYKMNKQIDGSYQVLIYSPYEKFQYKFTRGTIESIESRSGGRFLKNRIVSRDQVVNRPNLEVDIASWSDITEGTQLYSIYDLLLLFSFFQGLLLIITIPSIQGYNKAANRWLLFLIGFSSVIVLLKVVGNYPLITQAYPKLQLLPDFIFFIYSPLFYFYIQRLLFQSRTSWSNNVQFHLIPALVQFFVYMVYLLMDKSLFESKLSNEFSDLYLVRFAVGSLAFIVNSYYWLVSLRALNRYKENYKNNNSYEQNLQYLNTVLFLQAICLFAWAIIILVVVFGKWWGLDVFYAVEFMIETIWMVFSGITFFLGYFVIHEPDIFRVPEMILELPISGSPPLSIQQHQTTIAKEETIENVEKEMEQVAAYMDQFKPYTNPKLNLVELATRLDLPPYVLSRIINTGSGKNFFDFVNGYRIDEFKRRVDDPQFRNHTLLSIAFDVGFNSKTAFNRSFKKITNQTPSSYFNKIKEY